MKIGRHLSLIRLIVRDLIDGGESLKRVTVEMHGLE
jgi:hypothetical protein